MLSVWGLSTGCASAKPPIQRIIAEPNAQEVTKIADTDVRGPDCVMTTMHDLNFAQVYISKPADYPHSPSKLLLLLSSGTGIHSTNNQVQADQYAAEGFVVVMPDQSDEIAIRLNRSDDYCTDLAATRLQTATIRTRPAWRAPPSSSRSSTKLRRPSSLSC